MTPTQALTRRFVAPPRRPHTEGGGRRRDRASRRAFRVGDVEILIPETMAGEILDEVSLFGLPNAPRGCLGLINLRGHLVPVFEIHERLGIKPKEGIKTLSLRQGGDAFAVRVDALPRSVHPDRRLETVPPLPAGFRDFVECAYAQGQDTFLEMDLAKLLLAQG